MIKRLHNIRAKVALSLSAMAMLSAGVNNASAYDSCSSGMSGLSRDSGIKICRDLIKAPDSAPTIDDMLAAPEGTVFEGAYSSEDVVFSGNQCSDQGRPESHSKYHQYYSGCYHTITGVRAIGLFSYYGPNPDGSGGKTWIMCGDRPGYDEDYNMTRPVKFEISFYKVGDDGNPGECIYKKEVELTGRFTGVVIGADGNEGPLMEFTCMLDEPVRLETGYFSLSAVAPAEGEREPECWFNLFTADSSVGYGMVSTSNYGWTRVNCSVFSFFGDGDIASEKALKVISLAAPDENAHGQFETVRATLENVGSKDLGGLELALKVDGETVAVEKPGITLTPMQKRDYIFSKRIDLSEEGDHKVEVVNVTPGLDDITLKSASTETHTLAAGEYVYSEAKYCFADRAITRVKFGDVDNASDVDAEGRLDGYQDFTSMSADIALGTELPIHIESPNEDPRVGVWVDWNNDGLFDGPGELIGYYAPYLENFRSDVVVKIPANVAMTTGSMRMRLVCAINAEPFASGQYTFGQTEDYTLNVVADGNSPSLALSDESLFSNEDEELQSAVSFVISNEGCKKLDVKLDVEYDLPYVYRNRESSTFNIPVQTCVCDMKKVPVLKAGEVAEPTPQPDVTDATFVLHYDGDYSTAIGVGNYSEASFGQLFPLEAMTSVKGLAVSSIDALIYDSPRGASIVIYENRDGVYSPIYEQKFTPQNHSWNRVELEKPYIITGDCDIIFGVKLTGMSASSYCMGVDGGSALRGYGDVCNFGDDEWWSLADLGQDSNISVRANLSGVPTPELSWLKLEKDILEVEPGNSADVAATVSRDRLAPGSYEARIRVRSNDPLATERVVNIYMTNSLVAGIYDLTVSDLDIKVTDGTIEINSERSIEGVTVFDLNGIAIASATGTDGRLTIELGGCPRGYYVIQIRFADGTSRPVKMTLMR